MIIPCRAAAALALGWVAAAPVAAEFPASPPPGGEPREFSLPAAESLSLENGLAVTLIPFGKVPKATVAIVVRTGNINEGSQTWLADFTGDLMQEGAGGKSAAEIARTLADMGGSLSLGVGMEQTSISSAGLTEFAPQLVTELASIVMAPLLPADQLERIRADRLRSLSVARSQPGTLASEAFNALLYGDHPYGRVLPTQGQLNSITVEDVRRYYADNFGAQRTHVYIAGMFDREAVMRSISESLGTWKRGPAVARDIPGMAEGPAVRLVDRPGAPQSTIHLGIAAPDPSHSDFLPFSVTNTLLGGTLSSRITRNLREDKGYTYSPRSSVSTNYRASFWRLTADVTPAHTADSVREVLGEIRRLAEEPPGEEELDGVKAYLTGTFIMRNATRGGLIGQLAFLDYHGLPLERLTGYARNVHGVEPDSISTLARRYLPLDRMLLVVVGDLASVREQLDSLAEYGLSPAARESH